MEEGIVAGGGVTFINLAASIKEVNTDEATVAVGRLLLKSALDQPFRILMENAGVNPDEWLPKVKAGKPGQGINVNSPTKLVDLKTAGIVDPARVSREAVQNAVSIAGTSITMGALVVDIPEKLAPNVPQGDMGY
jgi:chaperonin GroEL